MPRDKDEREARKREQAWVGDAVLALYARQWILRHEQKLGANPGKDPDARARLFSQMTSNDFLAGFGQPTAVEAEIGQVYERDGLDAAFSFIEERLIPVFRKRLAASQRTRRA